MDINTKKLKKNAFRVSKVRGLTASRVRVPGGCCNADVMQQIVDIAREHHLIIFSDEIYDRLVMDGAEHISIASMAPDLFCVTFSGLSKSHMIAGFRIGWMILSGNKAVAKDYIEGIKMLSNMRLCSNVPAQSIVQTGRTSECGELYCSWWTYL